MRTIGLIPVRLESSRLPNKPLKNILGMPLFAHVYFRTIQSNLDNVYVCTDSQQIIDVADSYNIPTILTSSKHLTGTDRCSEAATILDVSDSDIIVNIQGDEALVDPLHINSVVQEFSKGHADIIVPFLEIETFNDVNTVKLLTVGNTIVYMSRSDIPNNFRSNTPLKKHLSIMCFTGASMKRFAKLEESEYERTEGIELLRAIENNMKLFTLKLEGESIAVDTQKDLDDVRNIMETDKLFKEYCNAKCTT